MPFHRSIELDVNIGENPFTVRDLRIAFSVRYDTSSFPASGNITIWNLAADTRRRMIEKGKGGKVALRAGYRGEELSTLFSGDIRRVLHVATFPDHETTIAFGGNVDAQTQSLSAVVNRTWEGEVKVKDIARDMIETYPDVEVGDLSAIPDEATETNYTIFLPTTAALIDLLHQHGLQSHEENGQVSVINKNTGAAATTAVKSGIVISEQTEMIGAPDVTEEGITVRTILNSRLAIGDSVRVDSKLVPVGEGQWQIVSLAHSGDTHGDNWQTVYEMVSAS